MKTWQKIREKPNLIEKYLVREKVIDTIRTFFKSQGFHEVETPILVSVPSAESNLEVFETELKTARGVNKRAFLTMSPEYSLKKLITGGLGNIFEITKSFRNEEEVSSFHNPEFTILEWYRVKADYKNIMQDFEEMFIEIIGNVNPKVDLSFWEYQGEKYNISIPWPRISIKEAFKNYCDIETDILLDKEKLLDTAIKKGYKVNVSTTWEQIFYQIFFNEIEPKLKESGKPAFIYDYPLSQAALAKRSEEDPRFAERFEIFLAGLELGNCFSELTDAKEQAERFEKDLKEREKLGKTKYPMDSDLIEALKVGMPQVSGIAVGVDRLTMLASDSGSISETLFFPAKEIFDL